ncbi:23S rRNA (uridine(2479)-2'-O)-methyltransferase [compost metagenome]
MEEAIKAQAPIEVIMFNLDKERPNNLIDAAGSLDIEWIAVSQGVLEKCSDTQTPQGIIAVVQKQPLAVQDMLTFSDDLVVVIDGIQDPGNLGTIIRSADAVGAHGVILGAGTVDLYNPKTIRSTMGSLFHLPIIEADLMELLPLAREKGIGLVTTSLQAKRSCYEADLTQPTWLIMGNEAKGVSAKVAELSDVQVIIPMQGQAESLNVAMAATVLLFEASRQRGVQRK